MCVFSAYFRAKCPFKNVLARPTRAGYALFFSKFHIFGTQIAIISKRYFFRFGNFFRISKCPDFLGRIT